MPGRCIRSRGILSISLFFAQGAMTLCGKALYRYRHTNAIPDKDETHAAEDGCGVTPADPTAIHHLISITVSCPYEDSSLHGSCAFVAISCHSSRHGNIC